ncbi:HAD family hydrolase [Candidatus Woesearchaeota archaeon]|nr:HAD family hydrolase [Candidatus Woesearchaeota archaeon]
MIRFVSFDLYNCLVDLRLDEKIWDLAIPSFYARERNVPFDKAYERVSREYALHGKDDPAFRDVEYWFRHLKLKSDWRSVFDEVNDNAITFVFDDVRRTLPSLQKRYSLVVFTAEKKEYAVKKLEITKLRPYFTEVFSTHEFGDRAKSAQGFMWLSKKLKCDPSEVVHVGDDRRFDYALPREVGMRSFLVDRTGFEQGPDVVRSIVDVETELMPPE